jgi:solute carrier family 25 phosphate transporter 23/24/25/41
MYSHFPFQTLKRRYLTEYNMDPNAPTPAFNLLAFGTFSSCCGQVAAYPLALVRTKLQAQGNITF